MRFTVRPINILLIEDNIRDAHLASEVLREIKMKNAIHHVRDGVEALKYLRRLGVYAKAPRPDLIFLDLNLPRKSGYEVLAEIRQDRSLRKIPVVGVALSTDEADALRSRNLQVDCIITKPIDPGQCIDVVKSIEDFWLTIVKLSRRRNGHKGVSP